MSSIHLEILDKKRQGVFSKLKVFQEKGYLTGGTALSLQIQHRHSFDFDIFLKEEIKRKDYLLLKQNFQIKRIDLNTPQQLSILTNNDIGITLVFYPYQPLFPLIQTHSLSLASLKDIALDKAFTIGRRATWRDYVDIFWLLKEKYISLSEIIKLAKRKFKEEFNEKLFLEQLVYFEDLGKFDVFFIKKKYPENTIKKYLIGEVKTYQKLIG
jgi:hypothetical protein